MRVIERMIGRTGYLEQDERILEWKHGSIQRCRIDGSGQAIPKFHGLERIPMFSGMTRMCYSSRCLFLVAASGRIWMADLAFIIRIWHAKPQSVCLIYSSSNAASDGNVVAVRWDSGETLDQVAAFADRIRVRGMGRLAGLSPERQERAESRVAEITASAQFESDVALLDEAQATAERSKPRTVVGRWLRASGLEPTAERDQYQRQMNSAEHGRNDDGPPRGRPVGREAGVALSWSGSRGGPVHRAGRSSPSTGRPRFRRASR